MTEKMPERQACARPRSNDSSKIERLARDWAEARKLERWLKESRDLMLCVESEMKPPVAAHACWKKVVNKVEIDDGLTDIFGPRVEEVVVPYLPDREEWCPACVRRQGFHERYVFQRRRRAGLQSALYLAAVGGGVGGGGGPPVNTQMPQNWALIVASGCLPALPDGWVWTSNTLEVRCGITVVDLLDDDLDVFLETWEMASARVPFAVIDALREAKRLWVEAGRGESAGGAE